MSPTAMSAELIVEDLRDLDDRVRKLEQERATWKKLDEIEVRVRRLEVTAARAGVILGAVCFVASAIGSAAVMFAFTALTG